MAERPASHPSLARAWPWCCWSWTGRLGPDALAGRLRYWLSRGADAADNARLIAGLFSLHRGTLVRNRALVGAVTDFLVGLDLARLTPLLPVLRRSLGTLSPAERAYLTETLASAPGSRRRRGGAGAPPGLQRRAPGWPAPTRRWRAVLAGWKERYGLA